jgi:hypothetical protein
MSESVKPTELHTANHRGTILTTLILAVAMAGLCHSIFGVEHHRYLMKRLVNPTTAREDSYTRGIDKFYRDLAGNGNVFLRFENLSEERDGMEIYRHFNRGNYALWPQRVYVTDPGTMLRDAGDILIHNRTPAFARNGIDTVVTFRYVDGRVHVDVRPYDNETMP